MGSGSGRAGRGGLEQCNHPHFHSYKAATHLERWRSGCEKSYPNSNGYFCSITLQTVMSPFFWVSHDGWCSFHVFTWLHSVGESINPAMRTLAVIWWKAFWRAKNNIILVFCNRTLSTANCQRPMSVSSWLRLTVFIDFLMPYGAYLKMG